MLASGTIILTQAAGIRMESAITEIHTARFGLEDGQHPICVGKVREDFTQEIAPEGRPTFGEVLGGQRGDKHFTQREQRQPEIITWRLRKEKKVGYMRSDSLRGTAQNVWETELVAGVQFQVTKGLTGHTEE